MWSSTKTQKVRLDKCILTAKVSMDWHQEAVATDRECESLKLQIFYEN